MIGSPFRLVRNAPLSLRPQRRSGIGTDRDEHERVEARGHIGARGAGTLTLQGAAALMGVSYRQAKRLSGRDRAKGAAGLRHSRPLLRHSRPLIVQPHPTGASPKSDSSAIKVAITRFITPYGFIFS
jgi:hypothetical protein